MTTYEAPAKLNLSLLVSAPGSNGYHPIRSLVQTVQWCDLLDVTLSEESSDQLESDIEDNLVSKALSVARELADVPPLSFRLDKQIPVAAGLGGGSSDAAATLLAASELGTLSSDSLVVAASLVGADVALFLTGGTVMVSGFGEEVEGVSPVRDFAVAVVVPGFGISTEEVYERWDLLEGPEGDAVPDALLPPSLRGGIPMRNDLVPAALDTEPRLGDFMADVRTVWGSAVCLTGSGSACFGYFATVEEAADAAAAVSDLAREGRGVGLRPVGVSKRVHESG
jgi:4-diphosphocytidyl-2-C-methyl-D-erythritol kinase